MVKTGPLAINQNTTNQPFNNKLKAQGRPLELVVWQNFGFLLSRF